MKPHLSLDVQNVTASVKFYQRVFGVAPQKHTSDYAKFDLTSLPLNFSLVSSTGRISAVNHLGIEVESSAEVVAWKARLQEEGILDRVEENVTCCFARQDKVWFSDPDGNAWEVFTVHEQLDVAGPLANTGCCVASGGSQGKKTCAQESASARSPLASWAVVLVVLLLGASSALAATGEAVELIAMDYAYRGPDRTTAGTKVVSLKNEDRDRHHVRLSNYRRWCSCSSLPARTRKSSPWRRSRAAPVFHAANPWAASWGLSRVGGGISPRISSRALTVSLLFHRHEERSPARCQRDDTGVYRGVNGAQCRLRRWPRSRLQAPLLHRKPQSSNVAGSWSG